MTTLIGIVVPWKALRFYIQVSQNRFSNREGNRVSSSRSFVDATIINKRETVNSREKVSLVPFFKDDLI